MKRLSKKIGLFCAVAICAMSTFGATTMNVNAATFTVEEGIDTCSTNLTWVYKEFDGVMYMRLYDHSTGEWLCDWIPV